VSEILIISPSGKLYGSEQVLADYVMNTRLHPVVAVPRGSLLQQKLSDSNLTVVGFKTVRQLYLQVARDLFLGKYSTVYVNEAAHVRYIKVLARLFPEKKFVVHVRIKEDTDEARWGDLNNSNTRIIVISDYLRSFLKPASLRIYDPFTLPETCPLADRVQNSIRVAVVGRVALTKGFPYIVEFVRHLSAHEKGNMVKLDFFGDVDDDVKRSVGFQDLLHNPSVCFHGFVENNLIYRQADLVLHFSKVEGLGRVYLEALAAGLPLIGFRAGGIGEVAGNAGLEQYLVEPGEHEIQDMVAKVFEVYSDGTLQQKLQDGLLRLRKIHSLEKYVDAIDKVLAS